MIARPTTTSQAATTIVKKDATCPERFPCTLENVTKARFAAFNINSININTTMAFLRTTTPIAPIVNSSAER